MIGPVVVRTARIDDLEGVLRIHSEHGGRAPGPASGTEISTWNRMVAREGLRVYLADIADESVGTASTVEMPNVTYGCAPTLFIEAIVVRPALRRHGVATALMEHLLDEARAAGCHKVQLLSHKRHATDGAHLLYTRLGFEAEAEGFRLYLS